MPLSLGPRAYVAMTIVALVLAAACNGDADSGIPSADETGPSDLQAIPMEALPDELPEPFIFRGSDSPVEAAAREELIYVVEPGDSLALIAEVFGVTTVELQRINGLADPSLLRAGDELRIPIKPGTEAERIAATRDEEGEDFSGPPPGEEYIVQEGDTLSSIGQRFAIAWQEIAAYNRLTQFEANNLSVGAVLIIPPQEEAPDAEVEAPPG